MQRFIRHAAFTFARFLVLVALGVCMGILIRAMFSQDATVLLEEGWTVRDEHGRKVEKFEPFSHYPFDVHGYWTAKEETDKH